MGVRNLALEVEMARCHVYILSNYTHASHPVSAVAVGVIPDPLRDPRRAATPTWG